MRFVIFYLLQLKVFRVEPPGKPREYRRCPDSNPGLRISQRQEVATTKGVALTLAVKSIPN